MIEKGDIAEALEGIRVEEEVFQKEMSAADNCEWVRQWLSEIGGVQNCRSFHHESQINLDDGKDAFLDGIIYKWTGDSVRWAFYRTLATDIILDQTFYYVGRVLEEVQPVGFNTEPGGFSLANATSKMLKGRRYMVSSDGFMALGPDEAQIGDWIFIIPGSEVPLLLRSLGDAGFILVGEIYVHGIMDGEIWQWAREKGQPITLFELKIV
jgi:hypothetical protein